MKTYPVSIVVIMAIALMLLLGGCGASSGESDMVISGTDLDAKVETYDENNPFTILDVRTPDEYNSGHIRYAVNLPLNVISDNLKRIDDLKDKQIYVICRSGNRSGQAQQLLMKNDFVNVVNAVGAAMYDYKNMTNIPFLRGAEFTELIEEGQYPVIDARLEEDFAASHIKGAVNIPLSIDLLADSKNLEKIDAAMNLDKQIPVLVYGYNKEDAYQLTQCMFDNGFIGVSALDGFSDYGKYPVE